MFYILFSAESDQQNPVHLFVRVFFNLDMYISITTELWQNEVQKMNKYISESKLLIALNLSEVADFGLINLAHCVICYYGNQHLRLKQ